MQLMLVRNNTPGPLVLVDERGGDHQEYKWEPSGSPFGEDVLEVPEALASNIHFRRNVQKGNLVIEQKVDQDSLMAAPDQEWIAKQRELAAVGAGGVPSQVVGETRTADGVPVIMDKESAAPITTVQVDEEGNVTEVPAQQQPRGRGAAPQPAPSEQPAGVPQVAGGHLDPNSP